MSTYNIGAAGLPSWIELQKRGHKEALRRAGVRAAALSRTAVIATTDSTRPPPVHTGEYRAAWRYEPGRWPVIARLFNPTFQSSIMEKGVRPGKIPPPRKGKRGYVPFRAILRWTYLKFKAEKGFKTEADAWGLAVAVQRKLARVGIKARGVLRRSQTEIKRITERSAALELKRVM